MEKSLHTSLKQKLHIYPFSGEWILVNDFDHNQRQKTFNNVNQALDFAREVLKSLALEHDIIIHSKYDSMPHFRISAGL